MGSKIIGGQEFERFDKNPNQYAMALNLIIRRFNDFWPEPDQSIKSKT